jgi:hypothetical protein
MRLGATKTFQLMTFVKAEYAESKMNDVQFAVKAREALGFELNANHVGSSRRALGLEANVPSGRNGNSPNHTLGIEVAELTKLFNIQQRELDELRTKVDILVRDRNARRI